MDQKHKYVLHTRKNELINTSLFFFSFAEGKQAKFCLYLGIPKCVTRYQMSTLNSKKVILYFLVSAIAG